MRLITSQIMMRIYENLNNTAKKEGLLLGEENKFLPRTMFRLFLHKLERNLMQSLELASIVS